MTKVTKSEFRRAQCSGQLAGCEMVWGHKGRLWLKNGTKIAAERETTFGAVYFLEGNA